MLSVAVQAATYSIIAILLFGDRIFAALGVPHPELYTSAMKSQGMAIFMIYFLGSTITTNLQNTGAFEVSLDGANLSSYLTHPFPLSSCAGLVSQSFLH